MKFNISTALVAKTVMRLKTTHRAKGKIVGKGLVALTTRRMTEQMVQQHVFRATLNQTKLTCELNTFQVFLK